jgi:hypothetical protein
MFADRVWSITRKGTLKSLSAQLGDDADIIPFPQAPEIDASV